MDALININYSTYKVICQCSLNKAEKSFTLNDQEIFTKLNVGKAIAITILPTIKETIIIIIGSKIAVSFLLCWFTISL